MKKIYLFIILLVSGFGFAQAPELGSYQVVVSGSAYGDEHHNCGAASVVLEFSTPADNYEALGITYSDNRATTTYNVPSTYKANKTPVSMLFSASRYDKQSCNGNRPHNKGRIYNSDKFYCYDYNFQFKDFRNLENSGDGLGISSFNIKIFPLLVIADPGGANDLPTESTIQIKSNTGFARLEYNWQYTFTPAIPNSWVNMPQFAGESSITTSAKGILGENAGASHGKTIYIRQKACNVPSNMVSYIIRQSAPDIVSKKEDKTRCFDTEDGKLTLKFSRPLFDGEKISFSIREYDEVGKKWKSVICSTQGPGDEITLDATNSYQFPCNFPKGRYGIAFIGFMNQSNTGSQYTEDTPYIFDIGSPTPVDFSITKKNDINCYGGNDGAIDVIASGGIENGIYQYSTNGGTSWITFSDNDKTTINNLPLGICNVKVRKLQDSDDTLGCIAKTSDGKEKQLPQDIGQPENPLAQSGDSIIKHPTFFTAENGSIIVSVKGGSLIGGNHYLFDWKNEKNELIDKAKSSTVFFEGIFTITLKDVPQGSYNLTVTDKFNCVLTPAPVGVLIDPKPIKLKLKVKQDISCNSANLGEEGNSNKAYATNGILVALAEGGKVLEAKDNKGLPYYFYWKKLNSEGEWEDLLDKNDSIATDLSAGTYSVNIKDANGIMYGTYNPTEQTPHAVEITIAEPDAMKVVFDSRNVSCFKGENGWAKASIKDGKSTYVYTWYGPGHTNVQAEEISNLVAGTYYVEVVDKVKGCFVKDSIEITEPKERVIIDYKKIIPPTFFGATNGKIIAHIIGGTPFDGTENAGKLYNYEWKNSKGDVQTPTAAIEDGIYVITLDGVPADDYFLTITDKNYDKAKGQIVNCSELESQMTLNEPDPLNVVFEIVRGISCNTSNEFGNNTDTAPKDGQRDESQDGILVAHVTGGIPLEFSTNNGLPYFFYWKKQQADGSWLALSDIKGETASNISHGNYALNIKDRNEIMLGTYVNNELKQEIDVIKLVEEPTKLSVSIVSGDVFCHGGNDGWATATASGGVGPYEYKWSNDEVEGEKNIILKTGTYKVVVTDFNKCTTEKSVFISEPKAPLAVQYKEILNPGFYKATNGKIVVEVTGGTISAENAYWFEWKNSKGRVQTTTTASFSNDVYTISLNGVGEEVYSLTVRDANYDAATNKTSCTVVNFVTSLDDPDPLEVDFEVVRSISCNVNNEFGNETDANPQDSQRDESQDGILVAHVRGGIQLAADKNNGLPYFYTWKKQVGNSWVVWNDHDETAENLSDGVYALNIEDANGIKLGTYVNNLLVEEKDVKKDMPQPEKLQLSFTKFDVGCTTGDDGWAEAHVSGGTGDYTYQWTNGETTPKISNITTNNYFVIVTDDKGCVVQGSIFVGDPNGIFTTETLKDPTCYKGADGSIVLNVTGGNLPYTYLWNTGATTKDLNNIEAGNYEVAITCPECCVYKKKFVIKNPDPIIVDLGKDRTLCNDQVLDLDATIADAKAQYSWTSTNGFTSNQAKVSVSKAGTYHISVTSGLGCIGEDEIVIKTSQAVISSEFLLSSQAYLDEEVILINTSNPFGESTNWEIPKGVKIVEQKEKYITLKFDAVGIYSIGLLQTQGDCYATYHKNITVEQRSTLPNVSTGSKFIVDFIVTPNPSNGNFKAIVNLENNSTVNLRLFSTTGQNTMIQKKDAGKKKYEIDFNTTLESGMYVLVLETEQQTLVKKIIIY